MEILLLDPPGAGSAELGFIQISVLAIIQGITEFLPISSSAHLILPSLMFGWTDQGLSFDVAVHVGTLLAVLAYFRRDLWRLGLAWLLSFTGQRSPDARLGWLLIAATVPAALAGWLLNDLVENYARSALVIGLTSIVFGLILQHADHYQSRLTQSRSDLAELSWRQALLIGCCQALALIPGTSRSGVTMTAALYCGYSRPQAARFSFLLAIPIIFASGVLRLAEGGAGSQSIDWGMQAYAAGISALVALLCIHFFLRFISRIGYLPFVVYRVTLGVILLALYFYV